MNSFNHFKTFAEMLQWRNSLSVAEEQYFRNIEKIEASKMKAPCTMILNQKFKTERFDFLLQCLEYIFKGCGIINSISYNPETTELKKY